MCSNTECEQLLDGRRGRKLVARPTGVSENTRSQTGEPGEVNIGQEWSAKPPPLSEFFQFILAKCESQSFEQQSYSNFCLSTHKIINNI